MTIVYRCECGKSKMMYVERFNSLRRFKCSECNTLVDIEVPDAKEYYKDSLIAGVFIWDNSGGK